MCRFETTATTDEEQRPEMLDQGRYSRAFLLMARKEAKAEDTVATASGSLVLAGLQAAVADDRLPILTVSVPFDLRGDPATEVNESDHEEEFNEPEHDDEQLVVALECRLSKESGADAKNAETFPDDYESGWSYEEAAHANATLLKQQFATKNSSRRQVLSTVPGNAPRGMFLRSSAGQWLNAGFVELEQQKAAYNSTIGQDWDWSTQREVQAMRARSVDVSHTPAFHNKVQTSAEAVASNFMPSCAANYARGLGIFSTAPLQGGMSRFAYAGA